jgi:hypothetical protein
MSKGFGIAALVVALIALAVPFVGIVVTALAVLLAIVAALSGDRVFATAVSIIAFVDTFVLSPSTWIFVSTPGSTGSLIEAILVVMCGAPLALVVLLGLLNRPEVSPALPTPVIAPESPPLPASLEVEISNAARESFPHRSSTVQTESVQTNSQIVSSPAKSFNLISPLTTFFRTAHGNHSTTDSNNEVIHTFWKITNEDARRFFLYVLYGALPVIAIVFIPETRTLAFKSAIHFATFLSEHRTVTIQSIVLLGLAEIFLVVGRRSGIIGVIVCVAVVGVLWWNEYNEATSPTTAQGLSQADADLVRSALKSIGKPYELPPIGAAAAPQ